MNGDEAAALSIKLRVALEASEDAPWRGALAIEGLQRLIAGASQELWLFNLKHSDGSAPLVLRRPPADVAPSALGEAIAISPSTEMALQKRLAELGVKTPRVYASLAPKAGERGGFIMDRLQGATDPRVLQNDPAYAPCRDVLLGELARAIAATHATAPEEAPVLPILDAAAQLRFARVVADRFGLANPGFEWALRWLAERAPSLETPHIVHGDFRMSNFMADPNGLTGLIDWELAHLGDPIEDLGWLCLRSWRFSRPDLPAAGLGRRRDLFEAYEAASGTQIDTERAQFWEALSAVKWAAMCLMRYGRFFAPGEGERGGFENVAIGRRFDEAMADFFGVVDDWEL